MIRAPSGGLSLTRLAYFSRNLIAEPAELRAEINDILATSQRLNAQAGINGALVFNRGAFGQILEGPERAVEETFERIQLDPRHHDVRLLEVRAIKERSFAGWSMGFCGREALLDRTFEGSHRLDVTTLDADAMFSLLHRLTLANELRDRAA